MSLHHNRFFSKDLRRHTRFLAGPGWLRRGTWAALLAGTAWGFGATNETVRAAPPKEAEEVVDPFGEDGNVQDAPLTYAERQKLLRDKAESERASKKSKGKAAGKSSGPKSAVRSTGGGAGAGGLGGLAGGLPRCGSGGVMGGSVAMASVPSSLAMAYASGGSGTSGLGSFGGSSGGATAIAIATSGGGKAGGDCIGGGGGNTAIAIASTDGSAANGGSGGNDSTTGSSTSDGSTDPTTGNVGTVDPSVLPPLNGKILAFAIQSLGMQVGNGECWTLGAEALSVAGAQPPNVYDFGDEIPLEKALPGDILQFYSAKFVEGNSYLIMGAPNHTGVLSNIAGTQWSMLNQNVNGDRRVQYTTFDLSTLTEGTITVYRAVPR